MTGVPHNLSVYVLMKQFPAYTRETLEAEDPDFIADLHLILEARSMVDAEEEFGRRHG